MVTDANTIVDPGTVMVEPLYTLVANAAVSGPICPDDLAIRTEQHRVKLLQHFRKVHRRRLLDVAGIGAKRHQVENKSQPEEA